MLYDAVANAIIENDALPQAQRKSNVQIAKECGTTESSVRRRRRALRNSTENGSVVPVGNDPFFTNVPESIITSRGRTVRLADGSYEKVTYSPAKAALSEAVSYNDIEKVFDRAPRWSMDSARYKQETFIIVLSDFQTGKRDALGGTPELIARIMDVYNQIDKHLAHNKYEKIIIADCGDVLEGFFNTAQQQQTDDLSLTDQLKTAQRLIAEGVQRFSGYADDVTYVAVSSNHCAVRTGVGSKNRANRPDDDFGLLVQDNIRLIMEGRPEYAHVTFVHPEPWEEACTVDCADGTVVGFAHGHQAKSQDKLGEWFGKMAFGHQSGLERADALVCGHFHNFRVSLSGDNRFVVTAPTMDNGSSWFSNTSGESSDPAVLTMVGVDNRVQDWVLWYPTKEAG